MMIIDKYQHAVTALVAAAESQAAAWTEAASVAHRLRSERGALTKLLETGARPGDTEHLALYSDVLQLQRNVHAANSASEAYTATVDGARMAVAERTHLAPGSTALTKQMPRTALDEPDLWLSESRAYRRAAPTFGDPADLVPLGLMSTALVGAAGAASHMMVGPVGPAGILAGLTVGTAGLRRATLLTQRGASRYVDQLAGAADQALHGIPVGRGSQELQTSTRRFVGGLKSLDRVLDRRAKVDRELALRVGIDMHRVESAARAARTAADIDAAQETQALEAAANHAKLVDEIRARTMQQADEASEIRTAATEHAYRDLA